MLSKRIRKLAVIILVTILALSLLTGCRGKNGNVGTNEGGTEKQGGKAPKETTELTFAIWDKNQLPGMEAIAAEFTKQNPDIKVKVEVTPWDEYWMKLEAGAVGGSLPDVFWMHTNEFYKYATNDKLLVIEEGMIDKTKFPPGLVELFSMGGKLYGVPKDFDTIALFYNKEIFDGAGLPYPDENWDWDKLVDAAKQLTDREKGIWGFGTPLTDQEGYFNFVYQNEGYVISDDKTKSGYELKETKEGVQFYFDMINKHQVSPTLEYFSDNGDNETFYSGKLAMLFRGSWNMASYSSNELIKDKFGIAVLPKGRQRASIYNGLIYAGAATSKHQEEVKRFLTYTGTEEANIIQGKSRAAIPAYAGTQQYWVEQFTDYHVQAFVDMLDYAVAFPTSQTRPKWDELSKTTMKKIGIGEISADEGCGFLAEEMNKLLAKEKK